MKYMGSKSRIAKDILPIITRHLTEDRWYVEPFAGGMNMMCNVHHPKRIANDSNNYLIAMWKFLVWRKFNFPKIIPKPNYCLYRAAFNQKGFKGDGDSYEEAIIGWIGFMGSFNGRFFDGGYSGHDVNGRDYIREQIRNTLSQVDKLNGVRFRAEKYDNLKIHEKSVIYCDPPYRDTTQYSTSKGFDHDKFWQWCREKTAEGHDVLISEYTAPEDFVCVWQKEITNAMNTKNTYKPVERLFVHKSIAEKYLKLED